MPMSEARKRANKKWNDAHMKERYDRVQIVLPAGRKQMVDDYVSQTGETISGLVNRLLREALNITEEEWRKPV